MVDSRQVLLRDEAGNVRSGFWRSIATSPSASAPRRRCARAKRSFAPWPTPSRSCAGWPMRTAGSSGTTSAGMSTPARRPNRWRGGAGSRCTIPRRCRRSWSAGRLRSRPDEPFDMVFPLRGADGVFRPFLTRVMPVRGMGREDRPLVRHQHRHQRAAQDRGGAATGTRTAPDGVWEGRAWGRGVTIQTREKCFGTSDAAACSACRQDRADRTTTMSSLEIHRGRPGRQPKRQCKQALAGVNGGAYHREYRVVWPDGSVQLGGVTRAAFFRRRRRSAPRRPVHRREHGDHRAQASRGTPAASSKNWRASVFWQAGWHTISTTS